LALFHQHNINEFTKLGIWYIEEPEEFFLKEVPLQRGISHPHKRLQHLAGRYLLKQLFPDFPYQEILIADTRKPYLPFEQYHFSISHCGNYAAAIVSSQSRVGIDIEIPSEKLFKISNKFLHPDELMLLFDGNDLQAKDINRLTIAWSAKESVFKWWSYGKVDFKEHIRLETFNNKTTGSFKGLFIKNEEMILCLHYHLFIGLCLVWMMKN